MKKANSKVNWDLDDEEDTNSSNKKSNINKLLKQTFQDDEDC